MAHDHYRNGPVSPSRGDVVRRPRGFYQRPITPIHRERENNNETYPSGRPIYSSDRDYAQHYSHSNYQYGSGDAPPTRVSSMTRNADMPRDPRPSFVDRPSSIPAEYPQRLPDDLRRPHNVHHSRDRPLYPPDAYTQPESIPPASAAQNTRQHPPSIQEPYRYPPPPFSATRAEEPFAHDSAQRYERYEHALDDRYPPQRHGIPRYSEPSAGDRRYPAAAPRGPPVDSTPYPDISDRRNWHPRAPPPPATYYESDPPRLADRRGDYYADSQGPGGYHRRAAPEDSLSRDPIYPPRGDVSSFHDEYPAGYHMSGNLDSERAPLSSSHQAPVDSFGNHSPPYYSSHDAPLHHHNRDSPTRGNYVPRSGQRYDYRGRGFKRFDSRGGTFRHDYRRGLPRGRGMRFGSRFDSNRGSSHRSPPSPNFPTSRQPDMWSDSAKAEPPSARDKQDQHSYPDNHAPGAVSPNLPRAAPHLSQELHAAERRVSPAYDDHESPSPRPLYGYPSDSQRSQIALDNTSSTLPASLPKLIQKPSEEYLRITNESVTSSASNTTSRKLIILDLNGALLFRSKHPGAISRQSVSESGLPAPRAVHPRPYMATFIAYLLHPANNFDIMVWSSAQPHSVEDMVNKVFGNKKDALLAIWARDKLGLTREQYRQNVPTTKDLNKVWSHFHELGQTYGQLHSARTTLLLDDSPLKAQLQPYNHLCLKEYLGEMRRKDVAIRMVEKKTAEVEQLVTILGEDPSPVESKKKRVKKNRSSSLPTEIEDTLLAVVGILDTAKTQSNIGAWIRSGGLWKPNGGPRSSTDIVPAPTSPDKYMGPETALQKDLTALDNELDRLKTRIAQLTTLIRPDNIEVENGMDVSGGGAKVDRMLRKQLKNEQQMMMNKARYRQKIVGGKLVVDLSDSEEGGAFQNEMEKDWMIQTNGEDSLASSGETADGRSTLEMDQVLQQSQEYPPSTPTPSREMSNPLKRPAESPPSPQQRNPLYQPGLGVHGKASGNGKRLKWDGAKKQWVERPPTPPPGQDTMAFPIGETGSSQPFPTQWTNQRPSEVTNTPSTHPGELTPKKEMQPALLDRDPDLEYPLWFEDEATYRYWVEQGRNALRRLNIPVLDGVEI